MAGYSLQFSAADMARKIEEVQGFDPDRKIKFSPVCDHALHSPRLAVYAYALSLEESLEDAQFIKELQADCGNLGKSLSDLFEKIWEEHFSKSSVDEASTRAYNALVLLATDLSKLEKLAMDFAVSGKQAEELAGVLMSGKTMVYAFNRQFAPAFNSDRFYLHEDVTGFYIQTYDNFRRQGVMLVLGEVERIVTKSDYMAAAVLQLVSNAAEHAFNPQNDCYHRMADTELHKVINVSGHPDFELDHVPKIRGDYTVVVRDNGFGIRPDILPKLFEKGITSKPADESSHGIGLWGVKQFVEEQGGKISVKTEHGKGTSFEFTIPYSHLESLVCIQ